MVSRGPSFELCWQISVYPRQDLLQGRKEPLPPVVGALVGLLLIRPEARLCHAQVGPVLVGVRVHVTTLSRP